MTSVERRALAVSQAWAGLAADRDLVLAGISDRTIRRRVARGDWQRVAPGVVEIRRGDDRWRRKVCLALLAAGPEAVVSHRSAAALHGIGGLERPLPVDVTVPRSTRSRRAGLGVHTTLHPVGSVVVDALPVTPVPRTLRDLAVVVPSAVLARAVHHALSRRVDATEIRREAASTLPGAGRLRAALELAHDLAAPDVESPLEAAWLEVLAARFPDGLRTQVDVRLADRRRARVDIAWPGQRVAVEVDGARWHADAVARARDVARHRALEELGWTVVHVTAADLREPRRSVALRAVGRALRDAR